MRNHVLAALSAAVFLAFPIPCAHAVNTIWSPARTVKQVYPGTTAVSFYMDGAALSSNSSCASANRFQIVNTHPNFYAIYSLLLTALAEQKPVTFAFDNDSTECAVPVSYIMILKQ